MIISINVKDLILGAIMGFCLASLTALIWGYWQGPITDAQSGFKFIFDSLCAAKYGGQAPYTFAGWAILASSFILGGFWGGSESEAMRITADFCERSEPNPRPVKGQGRT
ncbi:hypothetical protein [uncultured Desulfuromusa sp.]|uniref:hypothetical protein n=1 Tax=uncultured Desulfuromusa sp. TaxID=219183 RepID=UPI002AA6FFE3|nr:hypothetical protein [uncultured Desulfuromusa sp.]